MRMKHLIERCEAEVNEWLTTGADNANYEAETCKKNGGKDCPSCADGYHMNDAGKCVKAKGLGNLWKRVSGSEKTTLFPDDLGNKLDRHMDAKGFGYNRDNRHSDVYRVGAKSYLHPNRTQK